MSSLAASRYLTNNDANVLNALFDPESSLSAPSLNIDVVSNSLPHIDAQDLPALQAQEAKIIKSLDPSKPSESSIKQALTGLDDLIRAHPQYSSAYVNRAQARRLTIGDRTFTPGDFPTIELIITDLLKALSLASPPSPSSPVSSIQAKILSSAHTHLGYFFYKIAKSGDVAALPESLEVTSMEQAEEMASRHFFLGGTYGDEVARQMSVNTNPYAKLCGAIVKEALTKEFAETLGPRVESL